MELVELAELTEQDWVDLVAGEDEPFGPLGAKLEWGDKDRHVALRAPDGRLLAAAGAVLATVEIEDAGAFQVVGLGGLIVTRSVRGRGLIAQLVEPLLRMSAARGIDVAAGTCGCAWAAFLSAARGYPDCIARLANTDLEVFPLCLGGNVFGWSIDEERSFAVLDAYAQAGGNFIDTADIYGRRGSGGAGESERIIGRWMAVRGNRDQLVIATKVGMSADLHGLSAATIRRGIDASLERLGIDHVDLYYAHQDDPDTPLEETLGAFQALIQEGKIRHAGASNYSAERLEQAVRIGEREGTASYVALQPHYNLMERAGYEGQLQSVCERHSLSCVPYFGLARGFLTGKYRRDAALPDGPRATGVRDSYLNERGFAVLAALDAIAAAQRTAVAAVALAWLLAQPTVLAPIASATSVAQLAELLACAELELTAAELARLNTASA